MTLSKRVAERILDDYQQRQRDNAQRAFAFGKSAPAEPFYLNAYATKAGLTYTSALRHSSSVEADNLARAMVGYGDRTYAYRIRVTPKETHA